MEGTPMTEFVSDKFSWEVRQGDALSVLSDMPADSIDCVMTSPPYWGLRDYGVEGQLGLEPHPQEYLEKLWEIFDEVKRVLKPTGCCFVNMGDTYAGSGKGAGTKDYKQKESWSFDKKPEVTDDGSEWLKPKNLLMIPEEFARGMVRQGGWWLRNKNIWHKPNAMPSSVKDRFSCTWEHVFFFTKAARYWFDLDAVREPYAREWGNGSEGGSLVRAFREGSDNNPLERGAGYAHGGDKLPEPNPLGKNPGDCWTIPTCPFPEAHFAVYPPELIRKPIRAGCPPKVCVECGKPWERVTEPGPSYQSMNAPNRPSTKARLTETMGRYGKNSALVTGIVNTRKTIGWQPTCACEEADTEPGIVLDPFSGAGTTGLVCIEEDRNYIGIELSQEYCEMQRKRLEQATRQKQHRLPLT